MEKAIFNRLWKRLTSADFDDHVYAATSFLAYEEAKRDGHPIRGFVLTEDEKKRVREEIMKRRNLYFTVVHDHPLDLAAPGTYAALFEAMSEVFNIPLEPEEKDFLRRMPRGKEAIRRDVEWQRTHRSRN